MQVGLLNHLTFPDPPVTGSAAASAKSGAAPTASSGSQAGAQSAGTHGAGTPREGQTVARRADRAPLENAPGNALGTVPQASVILELRGAQHATAASPADLVYSAPPRRPAAAAAPEATPKLALEATPKIVEASEDGPGFVGTPSEVFVHNAVHAMREFAEEQERQKGAGAPRASQEGVAALLPRSLADIQKLAGRFKLFS